jgi:hypothetical protein
MPNTLTWYVGNRDPSITENITVNGAAFDLTSSTVKFKARQIGSSTLLVDAAATIVGSPTLGNVRYDWTAGDASTGILSAARSALVWWEVTTTGKVQDVGEAIIQVLAHAPVSRDYAELEDLKKTLTLDGLSFADLDIKEVITAASRKVDEHTGRRFWVDADANQVRYYSPEFWDRLWIDDLVTLTTLKTDDGGDGTFENTWTLNSDFTLEPLNAAADSEPWTSINVHPSGNYTFPTGYPRSVELTGKFGWNAVPAQVKTATKMVAHRYLKRLREAPHGVVGFGLDGAVVRMMSVDPDVDALLAPFSRRILVA